ncbi:hypothetical protein Tco_0546959 [Tanacetum coccineum]
MGDGDGEIRSTSDISEINECSDTTFTLVMNDLIKVSKLPQTLTCHVDSSSQVHKMEILYKIEVRLCLGDDSQKAQDHSGDLPIGGLLDIRKRLGHPVYFTVYYSS